MVGRLIGGCCGQEIFILDVSPITGRSTDTHHHADTLGPIVGEGRTNGIFETPIDEHRHRIGIVEHVGQFIGDPMPIDRHIRPTTMGAGLGDFEPLALVSGNDGNGVAGGQTAISQGVDQPVDSGVEF